MAKIYLDANSLIDIVTERTSLSAIWALDQQEVYISPLSIHVLFYTFKFRVPSEMVSKIISDMETVALTTAILRDSLEGPTSDLEDNIQLHSAAASGCDTFLTSDKKLLAMKFFGKMKMSAVIA